MKRFCSFLLALTAVLTLLLPLSAESEESLRDRLRATIPETFALQTHGAVEPWLDYWMETNPKMRENEMMELCFYSYLRAFDFTRQQFDEAMAADPEYAATVNGDALWELYLSLYSYLDEYPYYPSPPILKPTEDSDVRFEMDLEYEYRYIRFTSAARTIDLTELFEQYLSTEEAFVFRGDKAYATDGTFIYAGDHFSYDRSDYDSFYYLMRGTVLDTLPDSAEGLLTPLQEQPDDTLVRLPDEEGYLYTDYTNNRIMRCNADGGNETVFYEGRDLLIGTGLTVDRNGNISFRCSYDYSYDTSLGTWVSRVGVCVLNRHGGVLKLIPGASELVYYDDPELVRGMAIAAGHTYEEGDLNVRNIISLTTGQIIGVIDGNQNVNVSSFAYSHAVSLYASCLAECYTEYLGEGKYSRRVEVYQLENMEYLYTLTISNSSKDGVFRVLSVSEDGTKIKLFFSIPGADGRTVSGVFPIDLKPLLAEEDANEPQVPDYPSYSGNYIDGPVVKDGIESFINTSAQASLFLKIVCGALVFLIVGTTLFLINEIRKT